MQRRRPTTKARNPTAMATTRCLCCLAQRKAAGLSLARGFGRSGAINVAAAYHLIEVKLSATKVGVKYVLLIREAEQPSDILQVPRSVSTIAAQSEDIMPSTALQDLRRVL